MAVYRVGYRATMFAPRSAQADPNVETTVLTPRAGALHNDLFQISTLAGYDEWLPYLALPNGRKGRIDFRSKKTDTGSMTLTAMDPRVDETQGNAGRWLTQFYGDEGARTAMGRCLVLVEETLDGGLTWAPFFTGRVDDVKQKDKLEFTLALKDLNDDLTQEIFLTDPASDVVYARRGPIHPYALTEDFGDLDANRDKMLAATDDSVAPRYRLGLTTDNTNAINWRKITAELKGLATSIRRRLVSVTSIREEMTFTVGQLKARVDRFDNDARIGDFWVTQINSVISEDQWTPRWYYIERDVASLDSPAFPADNFQVHFDVCATGAAREFAPILIDDVHPATFLRDLFAGKFGILNTDGTPRYPVPIDEASVAALEADVSFPLIRAVVTEAGKLRDFAQEQVCQPCQIAYYVDARGRIALVDMRRASIVGTSIELTDADLVSEPGAAIASQVSGDAITHIVVKLRKYQILDPIEDALIGDQADRYPSVPGAGLALTDYSEEYFALGDTRTLDFTAKPTEINLQGVTAGVLTSSDVVQIGRLPFYRRRSVQEKVVDDIFAMFAHGGNYFTLRCRRTGTGESVGVGSRVIASCTALANALTNLRGGSRIGVCIERSEDDEIVTLGFADLGSTEVADPPVLGTPTVDGPDCAHVIHLPITLNAAGSPVRVNVAVVPIGDPQPAEASALWEFVGLVTATTADFVIDGLEPESYIYIRARSDPRGTSLALPSEWIFPTPDHVTTCEGEAVEVDDGPPVAALFCVLPSAQDVGVLASDTSYRIEVERSDDGAGTGAVVLTGATGVVGTTTSIHDAQLDGVTKWYRARLLFDDGDGTPAGEWTVRIACTADTSEPPVDPVCILPIITDLRSETPTVGTLDVEIADLQLRLIDVAFKHREAAGAETAYALAIAPYTHDVGISPGVLSTITRLVRFFNCGGTISEDEQTFTYPAPIEAPPEEPVPDATSSGFQIPFHAEYLEAIDVVIAAEKTELSQIGRRKINLQGAARARTLWDLGIAGLAGATIRPEYVPADNAAPAEEDWSALNLDGTGPISPVDIVTEVPSATTYEFLALGARQDVTVRFVGELGDGVTKFRLKSLILDFLGGLSTEPPIDPVPPGDPCGPGTNPIEGFDYADLGAFAAEWAETDTMGATSTWSITSIHTTSGAGVRIDVVGTTPASQSSIRSKTFGGYTPGEPLTVRIDVYTEQVASGPPGGTISGDFEGFANTAAMLAVWPAGTWGFTPQSLTLHPTGGEDGGKCAEVKLTSGHFWSGGGGIKHTFTGLTYLAYYTFATRVRRSLGTNGQGLIKCGGSYSSADAPAGSLIPNDGAWVTAHATGRCTDVGGTLEVQFGFYYGASDVDGGGSALRMDSWTLTPVAAGAAVPALQAGLDVAGGASAILPTDEDLVGTTTLAIDVLADSLGQVTPRFGVFGSEAGETYSRFYVFDHLRICLPPDPTTPPPPGPPGPAPVPATGIRALLLSGYGPSFWNTAYYPAFQGGEFHNFTGFGGASPANIIPILDECRARGWRVVLNPWTYSGVMVGGTFSQTAYRNMVLAYSGLDLSGYTDVLVGIYVIDEPQHPTRWGSNPIQFAVVDGVLAKVCSETFPGYPMFVRVAPTMWEASNAPHVYVNACWAAFKAIRGPIGSFLAAEEASAARQGLGLMLSLNFKHGGTPNNTIVTPAQVREFCIPMAQRKNTFGVVCWNDIWDENTETLLLRSAAYKAAWADVAAAIIQP